MIIFVPFSGSQDLNRPLPPSYNKFSSLDRRALTRRHQPNQTIVSQPNQTSAGTPNQIKLSTFNPQESKEFYHFIKIYVSSRTAVNYKKTIVLTNLMILENLIFKIINGFLLKVKASPPERRHSSYNPSSSLHRTPSQSSEYR